MKSLIASIFTVAMLMAPALSNAAPITFTFAATNANLTLDA